MLKKHSEVHSHLLACLLTFCAGFIDAYTFIERGGTLVAGQTGNVVFLSVAIVHDHLGDIEVKLVTLLCFMTGIFLITLVRPKLTTSRRRLITLVPLIILCIWAGFQPKNSWNMLIVPPLGFCMGVVTTAFTEVRGRFYNNAFMTGNLKRMMMALGEYISGRDKTQLSEALFLSRLVLSFVIGAIISAKLTSIYRIETIWLVAILLIVILLAELFINRRLKN
ncbi:hypothetical protein STRDD10_00151 [Streptococcus sp. DD10]|uniref:YoaK family protein n=1 Tax=Streptococcus sp. DD10 TaxID=1777878 RepID=UPI0007957B12|nr:YoaK family protein [Streptococcus sp. DD10]KXT77071.1 hypothetical protein STRDD10_00151 [Streptococcus sp. DD10]